MRERFSRYTIQSRVEMMGWEIAPWIEQVQKETGQSVLAVVVLKGALFFAADLMREIYKTREHDKGLSLELIPIRCSSYDGQDKGQLVIQCTEQETKIEGRRVLIIDDICDTGDTFRILTEQYYEWGAEEVRTVSLIRRDMATHIPDYIGFREQGSDWFVGYGMDDNGEKRNLPDIYTL